MDFELPEELRIFKEAMRRFVDTEMIPVEKVASTDTEKLKPEYYEKFSKRAKELGFWKMDIPEEHGGEGFSVLARSIVETELSRSVALPARGYGGITGPSVRAILYALTGEMKEKYLLPSLRGEKKACFAQTEPDAGSDPGGMRTVAVRDGDHYVINGVKRFISHAKEADFMQLMAATDRAKGSHGGISCFIVDMNTPGVKLTTQYKTMMGDEPWEIVLENVRVPVSHLVGKEGDGFGHAQQLLNAGRVRHGASALGVTERCLELATSYAKQRSTFGRPLADRQSIQWMLADMYVELQAGRLLVYNAAARLDKGEDARQEAYVCKYFCDEMAFKAADMCMQIHGGIALTTDLPIEKMWRQRRSFRITEGATEVMKMVIARHVLKTYA
jgi:acyl-CoA dehydrogenase